ncbi:unnamed protein product, partial [Haemonchus placei]|uniref:AT-hook motif nuclear-localized protein n=1 Tax=Haemonchus placei TaxID=6290 RepID=A0A0N4WPW5_HAEPC
IGHTVKKKGVLRTSFCKELNLVGEALQAGTCSFKLAIQNSIIFVGINALDKSIACTRRYTVRQGQHNLHLTPMFSVPEGAGRRLSQCLGGRASRRSSSSRRITRSMSSLPRGVSNAPKPKHVNVNSLYSGRNLSASGKPVGEFKL